MRERLESRWGGSLVACLGLCVMSCTPSEDFMPAPFVQPSADDAARWTVDINRIRDGVFRPYSPRCTVTVQVGHTVEFRNFLPEISANVTSIGNPEGYPLYSPNLMKPFLYVGPGDPANTLCDVYEGGECVQRPSWAYWRYTFEVSGVYDWLDTNQSAPGRKVVDPYYGTTTFVGIDPNSPFGTVCVPAADGTGCDEVCCISDADCGTSTECFKSEVDAIGRCLTPSG